MISTEIGAPLSLSLVNNLKRLELADLLELRNTYEQQIKITIEMREVSTPTRHSLLIKSLKVVVYLTQEICNRY